MNEKNNHTNNLYSIESIKKELKENFFITSASEIFEKQSVLLGRNFNTNEKDIIRFVLDKYQKAQLQGISCFIEVKLGKVVYDFSIKESAILDESIKATYTMYMESVRLFRCSISQQLEILENTNLNSETKDKIEIQLKNHLDKFLNEMEKQFKSYRNSIKSLQQ